MSVVGLICSSRHETWASRHLCLFSASILCALSISSVGGGVIRVYMAGSGSSRLCISWSKVVTCDSGEGIRGVNCVIMTCLAYRSLGVSLKLSFGGVSPCSIWFSVLLILLCWFSSFRSAILPRVFVVSLVRSRYRCTQFSSFSTRC